MAPIIKPATVLNRKGSMRPDDETISFTIGPPTTMKAEKPAAPEPVEMSAPAPKPKPTTPPKTVSVEEQNDARRERLSNLATDLRKNLKFGEKKRKVDAHPSSEHKQSRLVRQCVNCKVLFEQGHVCGPSAASKGR